MATVKVVSRGDSGRTFSQTVQVGGQASQPAEPTVLFLMRKGSRLVSQTADVGTITWDSQTQTASIPVSYETVAADLSVPGFYRQEWQMSWAGGATITASGWNIVFIKPDLNP